MERIVHQTMLYDFYGELLTPHQRKAYEAVVMEDLSCSELARIENISRQGAFDMIRRCDRQLEEYEEKLHMVERFLDMKKELQELRERAEELKERLTNADEERPEMLSLTEDILTRTDGLIARL